MRLFVGLFLALSVFVFSCKKEKPLEKGQIRVTINGVRTLLSFNGKIVITNDTLAVVSANSGPQSHIFKNISLIFNRFAPGELNNTPDFPIRVIINYQEGLAQFSSHYQNNLIGEASAQVDEINTGEKFVKGKFRGFLRPISGSVETRNLKDGEFFVSISI